MRIGAWLPLVAVAFTAPLAAQTPPAQAPPPKARPSDVSSIDAIVGALYDVLSGPAGQARDWQRFRSLFAPGARLIPTRATPGGAQALMLDLDSYIARVAPFFQQSGFFERELARRTDQFGNMAQVFSTYVTHRTPQDTVPLSRGINSIHLLKDGTRWWLLTVFWDAERPGLTIPQEYLPQP
jgi:hypothetical protein